MSEPGTSCPVCSEHSNTEWLEACLLVLTGAEALLKGDTAAAKDVAAIIGPYDGHVAITLYALMLSDLCDAYQADMGMTLDINKQRVRGALLEQSGA